MLSILSKNIKDIEGIRKHVKRTYDLEWSDLVVLCAIEQMCISDLYVKAEELIVEVKAQSRLDLQVPQEA